MKVEVLDFIKSCIKRGRIRWTYHINMRLKDRFISRAAILSSVDTFEIIADYPQDKYLPSYLILAQFENSVFHILVATDLENDLIVIITAYQPDREKWENDLRTRRKP